LEVVIEKVLQVRVAAPRECVEAYAVEDYLFKL
jgi:hypothetical protein